MTFATECEVCKGDGLPVEDAYTRCPKCGRPICILHMAGTGVCTLCNEEEE
jgi:hypothetical protein